MIDLKHEIEEFEQYHVDLRKLKRIFKLSSQNLSKFSENMSDVISICNPNNKWCRNDNLFISIKKTISSYMIGIDHLAKELIDLHKKLKDYGNKFKEFKKIISVKIKSISFVKIPSTEKNDNLEIVMSDIETKKTELNSLFSNNFYEFSKVFEKNESISNSILMSNKGINSISNGKNTRSLTPIIHAENSKNSEIFIKDNQRHANRISTQNMKKLDLENHEKILFNRETPSKKSIALSESENNLQDLPITNINKKSSSECDKKVEISKVQEKFPEEESKSLEIKMKENSYYSLKIKKNNLEDKKTKNEINSPKVSSINN